MPIETSKLYRYSTLENGHGIAQFFPIQKSNLFSHAFTTKKGILFPADIQAEISETEKLYSELAHDINLQSACWVEQVHSDKIIIANQPGFAGKADAIITATPKLGISCRSADCPLILLADPDTKTVAVVHASWRSTVENIATKTVEKMISEFNCNPKNIIACIGPSAGPERYEVGLDVYNTAIKKLGNNAKFFFAGAGDKKLFDLWSANISQLNFAGVNFDNTYTARICTITDENYPSYRREGKSSKRFAAMIGIL